MALQRTLGNAATASLFAHGRSGAAVARSTPPAADGVERPFPGARGPLKVQRSFFKRLRQAFGAKKRLKPRAEETAAAAVVPAPEAPSGGRSAGPQAPPGEGGQGAQACARWQGRDEASR